MRRAATFLLAALWAMPAWADGMLDPGFGRDGRVTTSFAPSALDLAYAVTVLPDGRAVAAGFSGFPSAPTAMAVTRYLPSGVLDTSFDGDGLARVEFTATHPFHHANVGQVLALPDGKLVLVGWLGGNSPLAYALARLNPDGSLDSSFGTAGRVVTTLADGVIAGQAAVLQPDGRIVVLAAIGFPDDTTVAAARYNADGSLDGSFGTAGQVVLPQPVSVLGQALGLQPDGRILIGGAAGVSGSTDFGVMRLLPSGALDVSFGNGGFVTSDFGGAESGYSLAVLPDGRIVMSGFIGASASVNGLALVRYLSNGALDTTFGAGGLASNNSGTVQVASELVVLPNGKLLVLGSPGWLLARFNADGSHDTSFGTGGMLLTQFNGREAPRALAIAGSDRVLAVGSTLEADQNIVHDFALARYIMTTPVAATSFSVE